jgi:periplasmic protein TonB
MPEAAGFFEQKRGSPTGFVAVVAMHAAVLGALVLIKGPQFIREIDPILVVTSIPIRPDPPPVRPRVDEPQHQSQLTTVRPEIQVERDPTITYVRPDPQPFPDPTPPRQERIELARAEIPHVRRAAELIGSDLQPPYPPSEERAQRGGSVQLRVTIGADGRVTGVQRIAATSDAFWRATERQALSRWRFRPATLDGRPVEASKVMTVTFRIEDI